MQRPMSAIYKIDGNPIPAPSSAPVEMIPLEGPNSGRTRNGTMHIELVMDNGLAVCKRKVALGYDFISGEQLAPILAAIDKPYYTFTFLDPQQGVMTVECYRTPVKSTLYHGVLYHGIWRDVSISMIER